MVEDQDRFDDTGIDNPDFEDETLDTSHDDEPEIISRTQKKQEAEEAQVIGVRLVGLKDKQLNLLDLPELLFDSIKKAQTIHAHGGKKRQLQFIGKLMRDENLDMAAINLLLSRLDGDATQQIKAFKAIEDWRDKLIAGGNEVVSQLMTEYPNVDIQQVRQLVRNANNKKNEKLARKASKAIFQYVKQLADANI